MSRADWVARTEEQVAARATFTNAIQQPLSGEARHELEATFALRWGRGFLKCPGCSLVPSLCVCARVRGLSCTTPHRVHVLLHHDELGRGSNTGGLLAAALGARLHVSGIRSHEAALAEALSSAPAAAVLWPGDDAVPLHEFVAALPSGALDAGVALVAVDGTWNGARKMVKRLPPGLPRLSLPPSAFSPGRSLLWPVRKYAGDRTERQCTYEAVVAALSGLGALDEETRQQLLLCLKIKVDALLRFKTRRAAYANETLLPSSSPAVESARGGALDRTEFATP